MARHDEFSAVRPFLLLLASCAATRAVPLTVSANRQIFVPVVVNGQRLTFQLDTGASASVLTTATWKKLGLPHGASEQAAGAGGQFDSETVKVSDLRVGERELHDMQIAVMDLGTVPGIDGVLGQDVLAHYIADIDLPHHQLVLRDRTAKGWRTPDLIALPYTLAPGGLIRIAATLGGRPLTAIVDLGAGATVANLRAAPNGEAAATASGADGQALAHHPGVGQCIAR